MRFCSLIIEASPWAGEIVDFRLRGGAAQTKAGW